MIDRGSENASQMLGPSLKMDEARLINGRRLALVLFRDAILLIMTDAAIVRTVIGDAGKSLGVGWNSCKSKEVGA